MATDIQWIDIVGTETLADGGYVGSLMKVASEHLQSAIDAGRLTQAQAGEVYVSMIPSAFQQAITFAIQEKLIEAQTDKAVSEAEVAAAQAKLAEIQSDREFALTLAEIDKNYGYSYTIVDDRIVLNSLADTSDGKFDYEKELVKTQEYTTRLGTADKISKSSGSMINKIPEVMTQFDLGDADSRTNV
jgi:hypothetical protein